MPKKIEEFIHHSRMRQEILFQLLSHNKAFNKVPVGELKEFARYAMVKIGNYDVHVRKQKPKKLYSDSDFNNFQKILEGIYKEVL